MPTKTQPARTLPVIAGKLPHALPLRTRHNGTIGCIYIEMATCQDTGKPLKHLAKSTKTKLNATIELPNFVIRCQSVADQEAVIAELKRLRSDPTNVGATFFYHRATDEKRKRYIIRCLSKAMDLAEIKAELQEKGIAVFRLDELGRKIGERTDSERRWEKILEPLGLYSLEINFKDIGTIKNIRSLLPFSVI